MDGTCSDLPVSMDGKYSCPCGATGIRAISSHAKRCAVWQETGETQRRHEARLAVEAAAKAERHMKKQIREARRLELIYACEKFPRTHPEFARQCYRRECIKLTP